MQSAARPEPEITRAEFTDVETLHERLNDRSAPAVTSTVPDMFAAVVRAAPDATALVDGERRWTYRQLDDHVQRLARRLRRAGLRPEDVVAICMPRSAEMVVGVFASMIAGGAFAPVDPQWPDARRAQVAAEASARLGLVTAGDTTPPGVEPIVVDLAASATPEDMTPEDTAPLPPAPPVTGARLAYVIFTSGSTGTPKGAMIRHEAICERLRWQRDHILRFGCDDASLFKAPLAFDISVNEILLPLVSGGRVVVAPPGSEKDPEQLLRLIAGERVTFVYLVSSMLDVLLALDDARPEGTPSALAGLRHVWCGGEVLTPDLFRRFRRQLTTTLYHGYGPAEATIGVSHVIYRDTAERIATSIGRPNPHTQLYVLDEQLNPCPIGVGGELYAAGFLLGRGYIGRSALTAGRFVANPFASDGSRLYRTGDLARWTPQGDLEFLGRADNQVKIRGRRVELEEIEVAISGHPHVRQAAVKLATRASGAETLIGYVTSTGDGIAGAELKSWLAERLPEYMVPATLVVLDRFPLNANGKIDREALPEPAEPQPETRTAPVSEEEQRICEILAEVLDLDEVGADDDFFALGGDSIVAVSVALALRGEGYSVRPTDIFTHRTPRQLAEHLTAGGQDGQEPESETGTAPLITLDDADAADLAAAVPGLREIVPVTSVQSGIYFHSVAAPGEDPYVVQQIVDLDGPLDVARLQRAAAAVVQRHGALAAGFHLTRSGRLVSTIGDTPDPEFRTLDAGGHADAFVATVAEEDRRRGFDLSRPPLMRYALVRLGPERHRLVQTVHHIIADGWSVALIWDDIMAAYRGEAFDSPAPQHPDFLRWWTHRRDPQREVDAWLAHLAGVESATLVAEHLPAPAGEATGYGRRRRALDAEHRAALTAYARSRSVSEGAVMTAAWGLLIGCLTSRTDVVFGSTTAGRGEDVKGIDRIVGMLLNTVPTRVRWAHHAAVDEVVRRFVDAETAVLDHQHVPLLELQNRLGIRELFDSLFSIENLRQPAGDDQLRIGEIEYVQAPHYRLTTLVTLHETVSVALTNDRSAVDDTVADRIADLYLRVVELIVEDKGRRAADVAEQIGLAAQAPAPAVATPPAELLVPRLTARFAASAEAPALVQGATGWTYAELGARVHRLARLLVAAGVGPDERVAVVVGRTLDLVAGLLAVITAGGVVVPLDHRHPAARLAHQLTAAAPRVVLATRETAAGLQGAGVALPGEVVLLDDPATAQRIAGFSPAPLTEADRPAPAGAHGAYLLFTSGSTGTPKGVLGTQEALANRLDWAVRRWDTGTPGRPAVHLAKSSIGFVDGLTETLAALLAGATLVVADEAQSGDADLLAGVIAAHGVTQVTGVPTLLQAIAESGGSRVGGVRRWISSGEALTSAAVERFAAATPAATVVNSYGSSEVAGDVTFAETAATDAGPITIGTPVPGVRTLLLDPWLRPVPDGVVGEVYVGGVQLARGYLGQSGLTAARFVADPFDGSGGRLYQTGDLARRDADGRLHYVGRHDFQVQINGVRIELEEVEAALKAVPGVREAAATVHRSGRATRLVGYVTPAEGHALDEAAVRDAVAATLPMYVTPTVVVLDALPLTPTGKVDRAALPAPDPGRSAPSRSPATDAERALVAALEEVLGRPGVGVDDDFFELGGDSISAMALARLARGHGLELGVRDVFTLRTPARLAAAAAPEVAEEPAEPVAITPTVAQHRVRLAGLPLAGFVHTQVADLPGPAHEDALRAAVAAVLCDVDALRQRVTARHKLLWTTEIVPYADGPAAESVSVLDGTPQEVRDALVARIDLTAGRVLHAAIVRPAGDPASLVVTVHGLAADRATLHEVTSRIRTHLAGKAPAATPVRSVAASATALTDRVAALEAADAAAVAGWIDELLTLPAPGEPAPRTRSATRAVPGVADATAVQAAFGAAVAAWSDGPRAIDVEWDLRSHLAGEAGAFPGALTSVYPVLAGADATPAYAPWHELLRHHSKAARAKLRRVPSPDVLLTRVYGPLADPEIAEGFEALYPIVARYGLTPDGVTLQVLGPDTADALLGEWAARLTR
ncbi:non-ribosomal peptide synthetase [Pseudonocardia thermophila]|uniref:non-ribosomal peptide synthetase n=1 Tax=Pseudonocardia thermophila TaxID=1848 RepID=UPI00248DEBE0|nr:non-ribosomal peptide synthetase [Pseudonocardia thermophila]